MNVPTKTEAIQAIRELLTQLESLDVLEEQGQKIGQLNMAMIDLTESVYGTRRAGRSIDLMTGAVKYD